MEGIEYKKTRIDKTNCRKITKETNVQTLIVAESLKGKFGPQIKDVAGSFYSFSKFYKGDTEFPVGTSLQVDVYVTGKGGKYLNSAEVVAGQAAPVEDKKITTKPLVLPKTPKASETMTKADWGMKDRSMLVGGLSHDAAVLAAVLVNVNSLDSKGALAVYKELLEGMLLIREQVK